MSVCRKYFENNRYTTNTDKLGIKIQVELHQLQVKAFQTTITTTL